MKRLYVPLLFCCIVVSCSKSGGSGTDTPTTTTTTPTTPTTPVTPTTPTTKTTSTQWVWQLNGLMVGGVSRTLTPIQAAFEMTLINDGKYADTDGTAGVWTKPATDSLVILKTNLPTPITMRYKIVSQTGSQLILTHGTGSSQIDLSYYAK